MAYPGPRFQNHNFIPQHRYSQPRAEANIFDLDDPHLVERILSQQHHDPRLTAGSITCRFRALPTNEPYAIFHNIASYGHVIHESRSKLIMKLSCHNLNLLNQVRQAWVSKYPTPFAECHITFDVPRYPRKATLVIIQRVFPRINKNGLVGSGTAAVASHRQTVSLPAFSRDNAMPRLVCNYAESGEFT
ncbi:hypothetical protein F4679DRAFT_559662 [Xylaria curta]|nr:hypothetical protein F4679DRAFT_559662 [Xylaria curta]